MRRWLWMLGGLLIWGAHFLGVYGIASLADVVSRADAFGWRMAGLGFSVVCVLAAAALTMMALGRVRRADPTEPGFIDQIALGVAGFSTIAIVWQALPTLVGH